MHRLQNPALAACGGDDNDGPGSPEQSVRDYTATFRDNDPDAGWAFWSAACQEATDIGEFRVSVDILTTAYPDMEVQDYEESVDGETATVSYGLGDAGEVRDQEWVYEDDGWKFNGC